jgi:hypothetical protein
MATTITNAAAAAMAAALNTHINTGGAAKIIIYGNNVAAPTDANTAIGSQTVLATFTLSNPAFDSTANGVMTLDVTPALTVAAAATGTAAFFRITQNNGTTVALQGSVTATGGGGDLQLNTTSLSSGVNVTITSGTVTMPTS